MSVAKISSNLNSCISKLGLLISSDKLIVDKAFATIQRKNITPISIMDLYSDC